MHLAYQLTCAENSSPLIEGIHPSFSLILTHACGNFFVPRYKLQQIDLAIDDSCELEPRAEEFIEAAATLANDLAMGLRPGGIPTIGFVPSDYQMVYMALATIRRRRLVSEDNFCEWGSGLGVVAGLAALLDFRSCGIEIDHLLVEHSRELLEEFGLDVQIEQGSLIPFDDEIVDDLPELTHLVVEEDDAYDRLGCGLDDFDLIFFFPWPGEEGFYEKLFLRHAAEGALLLAYRGLEEITLKRKVQVTKRKR